MLCMKWYGSYLWKGVTNILVLKKVDKENIYSMKWDSKSQDLICVVYNLEDRDKIDMEQLMESMDYTTDTFFSEKCYRSIQLEEKKKKTDSQ